MKIKTDRKRKALHVVDPQVGSLSRMYYSLLDCPRALTCLILLEAGEYAQLAEMRARPVDYATAEDYFLAASASDWLRKYPGLPGFDDTFREEAAKKSWYQSESECQATNSRLLQPSVELDLLLSLAEEWFVELIGKFPLDMSPSFGPGATVSDPATHTTVLDKVSSLPTITAQAQCLLGVWEHTAWERSHAQLVNCKRSYSPTVVEGNVFFCVPKEATTFRGCAKGPSINVAYQLSAGKAIRRNLKANFDYDLTTRQDIHRELARKGSLSEHNATIDCSRASDCMALGLIRRLARGSPLWLTLLESLREPSTFIDGRWVPLEKFSAMGNGYTFELETIVFLSLALAIATASGEDAYGLLRDREVSVYGDDLIVPQRLALSVMNLLSACGFTVNTRKSYSQGNFRESCGGDFFNGIAVNTVKLTKDVFHVADWFSLHNIVKARVADRHPTNPEWCSRWQRFLNAVKDQFPRRYRSMYGPKWLGDKVLHGWYGPQIRASARIVAEICGPLQKGASRYVTDSNQWVGSIEVLEPKLKFADIDCYSSSAQLAYLLYSFRSTAPARRPVRKLEYRVAYFEGDYHLLFEDQVPRLPWWLTQSPYARFFGIESL